MKRRTLRLARRTAAHLARCIVVCFTLAAASSALAQKDPATRLLEEKIVGDVRDVDLALIFGIGVVSACPVLPCLAVGREVPVVSEPRPPERVPGCW